VAEGLEGLDTNRRGSTTFFSQFCESAAEVSHFREKVNGEHPGPVAHARNPQNRAVVELDQSVAVNLRVPPPAS